MSLSGIITLDSNVEIETHEAGTGRLLTRECVHNLVPACGRNLVRDMLLGKNVFAKYTWPLGSYSTWCMVFGSGSTAAADTDTALESASYIAQSVSMTPQAGALRISAYMSETEGNDMPSFKEAGLFTTGFEWLNPYNFRFGPMLARVCFTPISKTELITVVLYWTVSIGVST